MKNLKKEMKEINRLCSELDGIYRDIAQEYGLPDSVFWILSILHESEEDVCQKDLCNSWYYSRQTVNSAIAYMQKRDWICLEVIPGTKNRKRIVMTETGQDFCGKVIGETNEIELAAYTRLSEKEMKAFINVFKRMNVYMREEYKRRHSEERRAL